MFTEEELASFLGVRQNTPEFVEIDYGYTNPRYGDTPGKLRAYVDGKVEIDCNCMEDCPKGYSPRLLSINLLLIDRAFIRLFSRGEGGLMSFGMDLGLKLSLTEEKDDGVIASRVTPAPFGATIPGRQHTNFSSSIRPQFSFRSASPDHNPRPDRIRGANIFCGFLGTISGRNKVGTPDINATEHEASIMGMNMESAMNKENLLEISSTEKAAATLAGNLRSERNFVDIEAGDLVADRLHGQALPINDTPTIHITLPSIIPNSLEPHTINNPCTLHHVVDPSSLSTNPSTLDHTQNKSAPTSLPMQPTSTTTNILSTNDTNSPSMQSQSPSSCMHNIPLHSHIEPTSVHLHPLTIDMDSNCAAYTIICTRTASHIHSPEALFNVPLASPIPFNLSPLINKKTLKLIPPLKRNPPPTCG
ncbi:hypothetical protein Salat_2155700 [Sesamum alatum]|uniref:ULTRAPETALA1/2 SAND domain-containing protein n=1 Tax=Sesamum alatum TaxID=300844 RepID=A0AAE1Y1Q9_9LAMI|nr:hypothetical protein Salat_2155700 [Sesamum alatum]